MIGKESDKYKNHYRENYPSQAIVRRHKGVKPNSIREAPGDLDFALYSLTYLPESMGNKL
eukprot:2277313-Amphidinium_carterae.1